MTQGSDQGQRAWPGQSRAADAMTRGSDQGQRAWTGQSRAADAMTRGSDQGQRAWQKERSNTIAGDIISPRLHLLRCYNVAMFVTVVSVRKTGVTAVVMTLSG